MKKKPPISRLKRKAWGAFSEWIRKRGMDDKGFNSCVTCGKRDFWKNFHAGHFYHGKNSMSAMDERNVWCQCPKCNTYLHGNLIEYSEFLRGKYGEGIIEILRELKHQIFKPTRQELEDLIERYKV